jgi:glycosyltransferase involved in cell wall biosynthesis
MKVSFITWYPSCRRSDAIAKSLGGVSHLVHYFTFKRPSHAPLKYLLQARETFRLLRKDRPQRILVASPPVFAVLVVWIYCKVFGAEYVIDAHTGIFDDKRWTWLKPLSRFLARKARTTIVTNNFLKTEVESWGARALIIGDVPVDFPPVKPAVLDSGFNVVVINTFSQDEPINEILAATKALPEVNFHITGNPKHSRVQFTEALPPNVRLTGWLSDDEYAGLLRAADTVMCLTTHDHTMQRGAYEAMALEKPLITSNWELLRKTFYNGTIHVDATVDSIKNGVTQAKQERMALEVGMKKLRRERLAIFTTTLNALRDSLYK